MNYNFNSFSQNCAFNTNPGHPSALNINGLNNIYSGIYNDITPNNRGFNTPGYGRFTGNFNSYSGNKYNYAK